MEIGSAYLTYFHGFFILVIRVIRGFDSVDKSLKL